MKSLYGQHLSQANRRAPHTRIGRFRHLTLLTGLTVLGMALAVLAAGCVPGGGDPPRESRTFAPQAARPPLTVYASHFDFPEDPESFYLLLYAGSGNSFSDLRTAFENERLSNIDSTVRSDFAVCDLGGDDLILVVPRYAGTSVTVREILYKDSHRVESGAVLASFEDRPLYVFCTFSDNRPDYEVHIQSEQHGQFFQTRQNILERLK